MKITRRDLNVLIENYLKEQEEDLEGLEADAAAEEGGEETETTAEEEPAEEEPAEEKPAEEKPVEAEPVMKATRFNYIDRENGLDLTATISITKDDAGTALAVDNKTGKSINFNKLATKSPDAADTASAGVMMLFKKAAESLKNKEKVGLIKRWYEGRASKMRPDKLKSFPQVFLELWQ